jgi:hypothetical protein
MNLLLFVLLGCIVLTLARRLAVLLLGWSDGGLSIGSLTLRLGLSAGLFFVLLLGVPLGWWRRHPAPAMARHAGQ